MAKLTTMPAETRDASGTGRSHDVRKDRERPSARQISPTSSKREAEASDESTEGRGSTDMNARTMDIRIATAVMRKSVLRINALPSTAARPPLWGPHLRAVFRSHAPAAVCTGVTPGSRRRLLPKPAVPFLLLPRSTSAPGLVRHSGRLLADRCTWP